VDPESLERRISGADISLAPHLVRVGMVLYGRDRNRRGGL
jgi:hypothetical protein